MCLNIYDNLVNTDELFGDKSYFVAYKDLTYDIASNGIYAMVAGRFKYKSGWNYAFGNLDKSSYAVYRGALHCILDKESVKDFYIRYCPSKYTRLLSVRIYRTDVVAFGYGLGVKGVAATKVFVEAKDYRECLSSNYQLPKWIKK